MNRRALALTVLCVTAVFAGAIYLHAGPLDPPAGPVASTMKTLEQVEARTPIGQPAPGPGAFPIVINQPGSYYLTGAITGVAGQSGIVIAADDVTLDLNGFAVVGAGGGSGIEVGAARQRVSVRRGTIRGWGNGILASTAPGGRFEDLSLSNNAVSGLIGGDQTMASRCIATQNGDRGIQVVSGIVRECEARENNIGITATDGAVLGCVANGNTIGIAAIRSTVENCAANNNAGEGIFASTAPVSNCVARSNGLDGIRCAGECNVRGNTCVLNGATSVGAGIKCTGDRNHIEGNNVTSNDIGIDTDDAGVDNNVVVRNTASCNTTANYATDSTDQVGAIGTLNTIGNNPWGNVSLTGLCQ